MRNDGVTAGALVQYNEQWRVVFATGAHGINGKEYDTLTFLDGVQIPASWAKLLCPAAPDIATALAELSKLPGARFHTWAGVDDHDTVFLDLEVMKLQITDWRDGYWTISAYEHGDFPSRANNPGFAEDSAANYEARTRDLQREGAVRAYLQHTASQRPDDASGPGEGRA